jgi:hypothetical protein
MNIIELILDEAEELMGIQAISIVESPAIEENFIAMNSHEIKFAEQDKEKQILLGPALIPNKPIYRRDGEQEYYVYFSKDTIRRASEMFLQKGNQNESTLEHDAKLNGLSVVESWIIEDDVQDKSRKYGLDLPVGTWMVSMKVNNEAVWKDYVKTGKVKGFSIEGYFVDKVNFRSQLSVIEEEEAMAMLSTIRGIVSKNGEVELESYSDYPSGVKNNAKRGIALNEKNGNKCATPVGKVRAQQLAQGKPLSVKTIKRMYSYLSRAEEYYDEGDSSACGTISYLLWGGLAGKRWAASKLKELGLWEE